MHYTEIFIVYNAIYNKWIVSIYEIIDNVKFFVNSITFLFKKSFSEIGKWIN